MKMFSFGKSLKARLMWGGILLIVIPLSISGAISWWKADRALTSAGQEMLKELSEGAANLVRVIDDKELKLARELATRPDAIQAAEKQSASFSETLKHFAAASGDYQVVYGLDPSGKGFADSHGGKNIGIDLGDRDYFKKAKAEMKPVVGDMVLAKTTGKARPSLLRAHREGRQVHRRHRHDHDDGRPVGPLRRDQDRQDGLRQRHQSGRHGHDPPEGRGRFQARHQQARGHEGPLGPGEVGKGGTGRLHLQRGEEDRRREPRSNQRLGGPDRHGPR